MKSEVDPERELLLSVRQVLSPTPSDQLRVGTRLAASIAAGAVVPHEPAATPGDMKLAGASAGLRGIAQQAMAATVIGALAFGAGYLTGRSPPEPAVASAPAKAQASAPSPSALALEPPTVAEPVPAEVPRPPVSSRKAADAGDTTLSEEARELQRVDRALRAGNPLLALGILRDLDAKIPRGILTEERTAARFIARCQNGEAAARGGAEAWLAKHPRSVYATRLQASCGLTSDSGEKQP